VDQELEIYFRLTGDVEERVPMRLRHATRSSDVTPAVTADLFQVVLRTRAAPVPVAPPPVVLAAVPPSDPDWLAAMPDGIRDVFRYLSTNPSINEEQATRLLGGPRQFRAFSRQLDSYTARVPFAIRVEVSAGIKCYVRGDR
jgi:hypothetical protein